MGKIFLCWMSQSLMHAVLEFMPQIVQLILTLPIAHAQSEICMCMYAAMKFCPWSSSTQPARCMKSFALQYAEHVSRRVKFIDFELTSTRRSKYVCVYGIALV